MKTIDVKKSLDTLAKLEQIKSELSSTLARLDATSTASAFNTYTSGLIVGTGCVSYAGGFSSDTNGYIRDDYRLFLTNMLNRVEAEIASLEVGS